MQGGGPGLSRHLRPAAMGRRAGVRAASRHEAEGVVIPAQRTSGIGKPRPRGHAMPQGKVNDIAVVGFGGKRL
jgi:hypothetical protein